MKTEVAAGLAAAACTVIVSTRASAAPVQWTAAAGGNGHYYEFVYDPNVTWTNARAAAAARTYAGLAGYLATVTSAAESSFLQANFPAQAGADQNGWLGGYQDRSAPDYSEPAGGYRWVTGEPFVYTNWYTSATQSEPDNINDAQDYIRETTNWQWDDFGNDPSNPSIQFISGYFTEYGTVAVPEPVAAAPLAAVAMIAGRRRARRRSARLSGAR